MATVGQTAQGESVLSIESRVASRTVSLTAGDSVTAITAWVSVDTGAHLMNVAIYDTSGTRLALGTEQSVAASGSAQEITFSISYSVPSTGDYEIAVCSENVAGTGAIHYFAAGSATSHRDADASNGYPPVATWAGHAGDAGTLDLSIYATYTPTGGTTLTPAQATVTLNGRAVTTSAFQNVRIRETLVNASGQAVGSAANISLLVWYGGRPVGAPDLSYAGLTTDANGTTSWSLATGSLAFNQAIFYIACGSDTSLSAWTCARMTPSYE